ncbi:MAG: SDR family oxidoreductase [Microthrixaceae bacterium]
MNILLTGATGYIGGRLAPRLLDDGHRVRCLVRTPSKLRDVPWRDQVEVAEGDVLEPDTLGPAMDGIDVVYYLVHSLGGDDFVEVDRRAASNVAKAAEHAGVGRIIYLGGLHPDGDDLSPHLASRQEVGQVFLDGAVPAAVLQAAIILGSGSASFEMMRYLTERLPAMITPRWVHNRIQPIAVRDVIWYLAQAVHLDADTNRTFDIGGPEVFTYVEMMQRYAKVAGLRRRLIIPVPVLTPKSSAHWVNAITPVPRSIAAPLIESVIHEVISDEHDLTDLVGEPPWGPTGYEEAVSLALERIKRGEVTTRWSGASTVGAPSDPLPSDPDWTGGSVYLDERELSCAAGPEVLWEVVEGIGGDRGWYSFPLAWSVRGWMDRLVGGVGLRRGRRNPNRLFVGEALDFWRVEELDRPHLLRLRAEMKVPGRAWLEFRVEAGGDDESGSTLHQLATFVPTGLAGHVYWWLVWPFHGVVFGGMLRNITRSAERQRDSSRPG